MPVKANQPRLFAALRYWFDSPPPLRTLDMRQVTDVSKGHGRLEKRTLIATTELNAYLQWPDVQQALMQEKTVLCTKTGAITAVRRYAVTSLPPDLADPLMLLTLWRGHWTIENGLHYPRDVFFLEDASKVRVGDAPQVMAILRNAILNLLHAWGYASLKYARERFAMRPLQALGLIELPVDIQLE